MATTQLVGRQTPRSGLAGFERGDRLARHAPGRWQITRVERRQAAGTGSLSWRNESRAGTGGCQDARGGDGRPRGSSDPPGTAGKHARARGEGAYASARSAAVSKVARVVSAGGIRNRHCLGGQAVAGGRTGLGRGGAPAPGLGQRARARNAPAVERCGEPSAQPAGGVGQRGRAHTASASRFHAGNPNRATARARTARICCGNGMWTGHTVAHALQLTQRLSGPAGVLQAVVERRVHEANGAGVDWPKTWPPTTW